MKIVPNLAFVLEVFPSSNTVIVRTPDGKPLYLGQTLSGAIDCIQLHSEDMLERLAKIEKDNSLVDKV